MPTKIFFGCGEFEKAPAYIGTVGKRVLIVTGKHAMNKYGFTKRLVDGLTNSGIQSAVFEGVSANPLTSEVNACVEKFTPWQPNVVVALGGGSAIDAAKGIILGLSTGEKVEPYLLGHTPITHVDIPLVAIPTTAGTGSETNWAAILTDEMSGIKTSFRHKGLFPSMAIVDPLLTLSLLPGNTVETGFDVKREGFLFFCPCCKNLYIKKWRRPLNWQQFINRHTASGTIFAPGSGKWTKCYCPYLYDVCQHVNGI